MINKARALSLVTPKRFLADLSVEHLCWAALIRVTAGNAEGSMSSLSTVKPK